MIVHKDWEIPHVWPDAAPIHAVRDTYEGKGLKQSSVLMGIEPNMDVLPIWKENDIANTEIFRILGFGIYIHWTTWMDRMGSLWIPNDFHVRAKTR